jgi:ribonuclease HI
MEEQTPKKVCLDKTELTDIISKMIERNREHPGVFHAKKELELLSQIQKLDQAILDERSSIAIKEYPLPPDPIPTPVSSEEVAVPEKTIDYCLYFDGASKGNPGHSGLGWILKTNNDSDCTVTYGWKYVGHKTNNQAEYEGLIHGMLYILENVKALGMLTIHGDSKLVIEQVFGSWSCNSPGLKPLHERAQSLVKKLKGISKRVVAWHVVRQFNKEADAASNAAVKYQNEKVGIATRWSLMDALK